MSNKRISIFTILASAFAIIFNASSTHAFGLVVADGEEEKICRSESYSGVVEISYSYSLETTVFSNLYPIIANVEKELTDLLSELLLTCSEISNSTIAYFDPSDLEIVGISSLPQDEFSEMSHCTALDADCTIVDGSLTLFLKSTADLSMVRYATRFLISQIMEKDILIEPRIKNLYLASYRGPQFQKPLQLQESENNINTIMGESQSNSNGGGLTQLQIVTLATLVSAVIGTLAAAVLFKKVFATKQNCFAACDGTGIERDYIDTHSAPTGANACADYSITAMRDLGGIDENSVDHSSLSEASIYSMSMSGVSHTRSIMGWDDVSVSTEKTRRITNASRNSTPRYGGSLISYDESDDEEDYVVQDLHII